MSGDNDLMIPHHCTEVMVQLLNAKVTILPGCGHALAVEAADQFNHWIEEGVHEV